MLDLMIFGVSGSFILCLLYFRFMYCRSLTGVGNGGTVGPSYWGAYQSGLKDSAAIRLPNAKGICPRCGDKSVATGCSEH